MDAGRLRGREMKDSSSIARRLMAGIALMCAMVLALVLIGESIMRDSLSRQQDIVARLVHPLADLNALQQEVTRIRALESELVKLGDFFAVTDQVARIEAEAERFDRHLDGIADGPLQGDRAEVFGIVEQWRRYRADLSRVTEAALRMDMTAADRYASYLTGPRFEAISAQLKRLGELVERRSESALDASVEARRLHRRLFIAVSVLGVLCVGGLAVVMARSMLRRLRRLHEAARSIAEGEAYVSAGLSGRDELAELGRAFDTMQARVAAREKDLRNAFDVVEQRVQERTLELRRANTDLTREVGVREETERRLRLMSEALEQSPVGLMMLDMRGKVLHANRSYLQGAGLRLAEVVGQRPRLAASESASLRLFQDMWMAVLSGAEWSREVSSAGSDGALRWESMRAAPVRDAAGAVTHALLVREDVTLHRRQQEQILQQAQYDGLTGLPNRLLAGDRLQQIVGHAGRHGELAVVLFLDLDDFKKVNDRLGHDAGDELLRGAADRLRSLVRANDTVARLGGDEFLVLLGGIGDLASAEAMAGKVVSVFAEPFEVAGTEEVVSVSVGLAVFPHDGAEPATLLRHADLAMYEAKAAGRNRYRFFDRSIHERSLEQTALENLLRHAIERGEFELTYQPIWRLPGRELIGAEALPRWNSGERGVVPPEQFVGIAERSGQMVAIGERAIRAALAQLADWPVGGDFRLSIGVSPRQFRGAALLETLRSAIADSGTAAASVRLEITEGLLADGRPEVLELLDALVALGVGLVMDDFGTGHASLDHLRRYPFAALKIDGHFISGVSEDRERQLLAAAVQLGRSMSLDVIADGVDREEQLAYLLAEGCPAAQGDLLGRPVTAREFARRWLPAAGDADGPRDAQTGRGGADLA